MKELKVIGVNRNILTIDTDISALSRRESDDIFNNTFPHLVTTLYKKMPLKISETTTNTIYHQMSQKRKNEGRGRQYNKRQRQGAQQNE